MQCYKPVFVHLLPACNPCSESVIHSSSAWGWSMIHAWSMPLNHDQSTVQALNYGLIVIRGPRWQCTYIRVTPPWQNTIIKISPESVPSLHSFNLPLFCIQTFFSQICQYNSKLHAHPDSDSGWLIFVCKLTSWKVTPGPMNNSVSTSGKQHTT